MGIMKSISHVKSLMRTATVLLFIGICILLFPGSKSVNSSSNHHEPGNKLMLKIIVSTNVECFTCEYQSQLTGSYAVAGRNQSTEFSGLRLSIPTDFIDCNNEIINNDMKQMLKSGYHPEIHVNIDDFSVINTRNSQTFTDVVITMVGTRKRYSVPVLTFVQNEQLFLQGSVQILLSDFGLKPPKKLLGLVRVKDFVGIQFNLIFPGNSFQRAMRL
jgi:hypothetical protein